MFYLILDKILFSVSIRTQPSIIFVFFTAVILNIGVRLLHKYSIRRGNKYGLKVKIYKQIAAISTLSMFC